MVEQRQPSFISVSERGKTFILQNCQKDFPGEDYREFIELATLKPGALL